MSYQGLSGSTWTYQGLARATQAHQDQPGFTNQPGFTKIYQGSTPGSKRQMPRAAPTMSQHMFQALSSAQNKLSSTHPHHTHIHISTQHCSASAPAPCAQSTQCPTACAPAPCASASPTQMSCCLRSTARTRRFRSLARGAVRRASKRRRSRQSGLCSTWHALRCKHVWGGGGLA